MKYKLRYASSLVFSFTEKICLAIPQGKDYSVEEGHYGRPSSLLILLVPIVIIVGLFFLFRYLRRYKDSALESAAEISGIAFGTMSNGIVILLKVLLFGLGLFALVIFFVLLSRFEPFSNLGIVYEKIMIILFAIIAFGGPSIYKNLTKDPIHPKQTTKQPVVSTQVRVIDTDEGVVDLGLSVLWTDVSFPLNLTFRDMRKSYLLSNAFRFPTKEELDELRKKCKWKKTYIDEEHFGFKVIGPNGNSIFLQSSYKNEDNVKRELTTYPLYISINIVDGGKYYVWKYSNWSKIPLFNEQIYPASYTDNSYVGKVFVQDR